MPPDASSSVGRATLGATPHKLSWADVCTPQRQLAPRPSSASPGPSRVVAAQKRQVQEEKPSATHRHGLSRMESGGTHLVGRLRWVASAPLIRTFQSPPIMTSAAPFTDAWADQLDGVDEHTLPLIRAAIPPIVGNVLATPESLAQFRGFFEAMGQQPAPEIPGITFHSVSFLGRDGHDIGVIIADNAAAPAASGALLLLHGGGFVAGHPSMNRTLMGGIAAAAGIKVFNIDYRLAPEHPFPAALHDSIAAVEWLRRPETTEKFGIDASKIGLFGESAGTSLAMSTLAYFAADKPQRLQLAVLSAPAGLIANDDQPSKAEPHPPFLWNLDSTAPAREAAFPAAALEAAKKEGILHLAFPLDFPSELLRTLPPVHLLIDGRDIFRDEGLELSKKLQGE